ncbi:MAG: hypothetical protein QOI54_732 [Actinomycetota bacterium]|jgi:hypothetical protein|nr:hypothetical protein [Actinomycetota bacterium]
MSLFSRRPVSGTVEAAPIPVPRFSIDGWTLDGVPLAVNLTANLSRADLRELETLLHGIAVAVDTPYTYERAAVLLERAGDAGAALSVCQAWLTHPAGAWPEYVHHTRAIDKRRVRLHSRLVGRAPTTTAAS